MTVGADGRRRGFLLPVVAGWRRRYRCRSCGVWPGGSHPLGRRSSWRRSWLWLRITRMPWAATLGLAVVATFFARGGRPVTPSCWISIRHPVPAASRGDIVVDEDRAIWRAMAVVYIFTLMKASLVQRPSNRSCYFGENPEI
jgi:hypothetical protein